LFSVHSESVKPIGTTIAVVCLAAVVDSRTISGSLVATAGQSSPSIVRVVLVDGSKHMLESMGRGAVGACTTVISILAVLWATLGLALRTSSWTPPVRTVFFRQLLFTMVDATTVAIRFGAAAGILVIVQAAFWIDAFGVPTDTFRPLLWPLIVRELAPMLACLVVIGRSGIAISTELATMLIHGEIEVLDSQGIDPMTALVMPRILSMTISVFCLAIVTATSMLVTGYAIGWAVDTIRVSWVSYFSEILREFSSVDLIFFLPKTIIAGAFAGAVCCLDGLSVRGTLTDVPRVSSRSGTRALTAVFVVSAILSVLIYGRILAFKIV
jgi:phospholipid/cholesterol/gamma-HCH transport system permease protein